MLRHNYEIGQLKKLVKNSSKVTKDEFLSHIGVHHTGGASKMPLSFKGGALTMPSSVEGVASKNAASDDNERDEQAQRRAATQSPKARGEGGDGGGRRGGSAKAKDGA